MGCASSNQKDCQVSKPSPSARVMEYEKQSKEFLKTLKFKPKTLNPENYHGGFISAGRFYNYFHDGFCSPYLRNPYYMLIVDFRTIGEYEESRVLTAIHYRKFESQWNAIGVRELLSRFHYIIFYDHDGTAAANVRSTITGAFEFLINSEIEVNCVVGGFRSISYHFPHLIFQPLVTRNEASFSSPSSEPSSGECSDNSTSTLPAQDGTGISTFTDLDIGAIIPWMPTLICHNNVFLGRREQAEDAHVLKGLGVSHVLSIGRSPELCLKSIKYLGLDGQKNLLRTMTEGTEFIESAVHQGGKVLVHGIEGLNRSAAIVIAYIMSTSLCLLDDAIFFLKTLKPHLQMDEEAISCLLKWEESMFGHKVSNYDNIMWFEFE